MAQNAIARWIAPQFILVATNLVEDHTFILCAIYQAKLSRAKVFLVHVIPPSHRGSEAVSGVPCVQPSLIVQHVRAKLDERAAEFRQEGIECEPIVLNGLPEEQVSLFVKSRIVDRVVVAAGSASGQKHLIGDSVAEALRSGVEIPVCTIPRHIRPELACASPPERILLATSLQGESPMLARFASTLAELHQSRLTLLHVLDVAGMTEQEREMARFSARNRLSGLIQRESRRWHQPVLLIQEGDPRKIIRDTAYTMSQDLIILGGPFPSLFSWILGTSVVRRVIAEASCPVITIKFPADAANEEAYRQEAIDADAMLAHSIACNEEAVSSR